MFLIYLHRTAFCCSRSKAAAYELAFRLEQLHGPAQVHVLAERHQGSSFRGP